MQTLLDEGQGGTLATGGQCVVGVVTEFGICAATGRQLRGTGVQACAHQLR